MGANTVVCGRQPVRSLLAAKRRSITQLYLGRSANGAIIKEIRQLARDLQLPIKEVPTAKLDTLGAGKHHQGVIAITQSICYAPFAVVWNQMASDGAVLVCDQIQDPVNLGHLIRTAEALGFAAVIIPKRGGVGISATVERSASGALEYLPVIQVTNIAAALQELKNHGFWVAGCIAAGGQPPWQTDLHGRIALVVGNEGRGIRRLVQDRCDHLLTIPQRGQTASLNVAAAGAIVMAEVTRQRGMHSNNS